MEGGNEDPYEEQLLAVFNSCLEEGHTELRSEGLRALCDKLQLEEQSEQLINCLTLQAETSVTFATFRDGLLKLLGQNQGSSRNFRGRDAADDSLSHCHANEARSVRSDYASQAFSYRIFIRNDSHPGCRVSIINLCKGGVPSCSPGRPNGTTNGEIDHAEICRPSGAGCATAPKEMLEQIFEKLDMDCDGLISFDEFVLLFENDKCTREQPAALDWSDAWPRNSAESSDNRDIVHVLGPHQTGYAKISAIVGMWEVAGVSDAASLLSDLGFTGIEVSLSDLTTVLCEELKNLRDEPDNAVTSTHMSLLKGALTLYQEEVRCMNTLVEHLSGERDKLRIDVAEANERANLLAQEIDEHHVRLEKSRQEQLKQLELRHAEITKDLSVRCTSEREAHTAALKNLERQLEAVRYEEQQARTKLALVLQENQSLETEVEKLCDQVTKLRSTNGQLLIQVQHLAAEHEEIDTSDDGRESEQIIQLVERIKRLQGDVALLRDQNDELTTELEFMKNRGIETKRSRDDESAMNIDDSSDKSRDEKPNMGNDNEIEDDTSLSDSTASVRNIIRELENLANTKYRCTSESCSLAADVRTFVADLKSNLRRMSSVSMPIADAKEVECEERTSESLRDLVVVQTEKPKLAKYISHSDDTINIIDKNFNSVDTKSIARNKITGLRDYPPRREEATSAEISKQEDDRSNLSSSLAEKLNPEESIGERESAENELERKQLTDRCAELERSLDLLRSEYEQCEDYWAAKLEEERQLFEQEQKISDDKFSELIAKMAEYEEQFGPGDDNRRNDGRLSPIEEKFNLEQQYADLEEEYRRSELRNQQILSQRENELRELRERWEKEKTMEKAPTADASTQFSLDVIDLRRVPRHLPISSLAAGDSSSECHPGCSIITSHSTVPKKFLRCDTSTRGTFDPSNLNEIAESPDSIYSVPLTPKVRECYCQQIEAYNSMEELCRVHRAELHRLYQKKLEIDNECISLTRQKETLIKGVSELRDANVTDRLLCSTDNNVEESNRGLGINVLKALNERLLIQEKKRKNLKISLSRQQHMAERILQQTWQQHCQEVSALRFALQATKEQLKKQCEKNQEQAERLAKADILSTDLYVQNAHLVASVKRLEQHCHILAQFGGESTSV